jgi:hypothetical protein
MAPAAQEREESSGVEDEVLRLVTDRSLRTSELMAEAGEHGLSSADVREAVWTLLDDGRLALTSDRHLTLP